MFTGIIEQLATLTAIKQENTNLTFTFSAPMAAELSIDQSLSHNGVCLTVTEIILPEKYTVTAIGETLQKTNLGNLQTGDKVNLERCMPANGRFDGHIVQGHIDQTGICTKITDENGSWRFWFEYDASAQNITVSKGSICVNGVSLTVVDTTENGFSVAIIPYTYQHTNFNDFQVGSIVNLEFDILGKYIQRILGNKWIG
ncbi:MAG: riboflavin synthase [Verrucomicrobia bacterium]|nr:riboflavin synthase [Cytophagales bacterium]